VDRYLLGNPVRLSNTVRQRNADGTLTLVNPTTAVYTVLRPDGTTQTYSSPTSDGTGLLHQDLSDTADVTQLGVYQWKLKTTGAGAGTATGSFQIVESFALPDLEVWRPSRVQVAKYVPERTVAADQLSDFPLNDFTAATTPTADQADMHIDDAASWVALRVGTLDPSLYLDASADRGDPRRRNDRTVVPGPGRRHQHRAGAAGPGRCDGRTAGDRERGRQPRHLGPRPPVRLGVPGPCAVGRPPRPLVRRPRMTAPVPQYPQAEYIALTDTIHGQRRPGLPCRRSDLRLRGRAHPGGCRGRRRLQRGQPVDSNEAQALLKALAKVTGDSPVPALDQLRLAKEEEGAPEPGSVGAFDPSRHTVADVNAYLADQSDAEKARVIEAERSTQGRNGIIDGPHAKAAAAAPVSARCAERSRRPASDASARSGGSIAAGLTAQLALYHQSAVHRDLVVAYTKASRTTRPWSSSSTTRPSPNC
jgi:hypothetical protein